MMCIVGVKAKNYNKVRDCTKNATVLVKITQFHCYHLPVTCYLYLPSALNTYLYLKRKVKPICMTTAILTCKKKINITTKECLREKLT